MTILKKKLVSYSIWLMPYGSKFNQLQELIKFCSSFLNSPLFQPHVTLCGGFQGDYNDILIKAERISRQIKPFLINFNQINSSNQFFYSIFVDVILDHKRNEARKICVKHFSDEKKIYKPHLSLAYGIFNRNQIAIIKRKNINIKNFFVDKIIISKNDEVNLKWKVLDEIYLL